MACDLNLVGLVILYRMVPSMMSAFEFVGFTVQRQSQNLMPEADPENRKNPKQAADFFNSAFHCGRITGAVGKKNTIRIHLSNDFSGRVPGDDGDVDSQCCHQPQNVTFDAEIVCHDFQGNTLRFRRPEIRFLGRNHSGQVSSFHGRQRHRFFPQKIKGVQRV